MKYRIKVSRQAELDGNRIFAWLFALSPSGAASWLDAFQSAVDSLEQTALHHGHAAEERALGRDIREKFFKTSQGRKYRLLYRLKGDEVRVLRIRGPGQPPLRRRDLK